MPNYSSFRVKATTDGRETTYTLQGMLEGVWEDVGTPVVLPWDVSPVFSVEVNGNLTLVSGHEETIS